MDKNYLCEGGFLSVDQDWIDGKYKIFWTSPTGAIYREHWFQGAYEYAIAQQALDEYAKQNNLAEAKNGKE